MLVIEDNRDIAENIADFFEPQGHLLDFATNGEQGLQMALDGDFDVIVLDLMLPRMDGFTVCRNLRQAHNATPVLMLTARDQLDDKLQRDLTVLRYLSVARNPHCHLAPRSNRLLREGRVYRLELQRLLEHQVVG